MSKPVEKMEIAIDELAEQYLTFSLAGEEYGVDILGVQEVKVWTGVTVLPNTPVYIKGVLDLRGSIVPIIDLRARFNIDNVDYDDTTVIVVLKLAIDNRDRIIGLVVDSVSDVLDIKRSDIKPIADIELQSRSDAVTGVATVNSKLVILLDAARLYTSSKLEKIGEAS